MDRKKSEEQLAREVMDRIDLPLAQYIYPGRGSVITGVPPFPPKSRHGKRRTKVIATPEFLRHKRGFVPADVAAILTEVEYPVERVGICFYRESRVSAWVTSMGRVVEIAAFGVSYRIIFHRASFDC